MFTLQLFIKDITKKEKEENIPAGFVRVDLFKDESVTITQTIQNVRDIGSVFTDFTRTFNIPASPSTNKIFKHHEYKNNAPLRITQYKNSFNQNAVSPLGTYQYNLDS